MIETLPSGLGLTGYRGMDPEQQSDILMNLVSGGSTATTQTGTILSGGDLNSINDDVCPICLEGNRDEVLLTTYCGHGFHLKCFGLCFVRDPRCPYCRRNLQNTPMTFHKPE